MGVNLLQIFFFLSFLLLSLFFFRLYFMFLFLLPLLLYWWFCLLTLLGLLTLLFSYFDGISLFSLLLLSFSPHLLYRPLLLFLVVVLTLGYLVSGMLKTNAECLMSLSYIACLNQLPAPQIRK